MQLLWWGGRRRKGNNCKVSETNSQLVAKVPSYLHADLTNQFCICLDKNTDAAIVGDQWMGVGGTPYPVLLTGAKESHLGCMISFELPMGFPNFIVINKIHPKKERKKGYVGRFWMHQFTQVAALHGEIGASSVEGFDMKIKLKFANYMANTTNCLLAAIFKKLTSVAHATWHTFSPSIFSYLH